LVNICPKESTKTMEITMTGKPAYLAGRLKLRKEDERELQGWRGRTVEIPDYSLETSRAGFVYRGGRLYNVNLHVQEGSKDVGERKDTNKAQELTLKEKKRRGKPRPSK
jgi:hypothetical protein